MNSFETTQHNNTTTQQHINATMQQHINPTGLKYQGICVEFDEFDLAEQALINQFDYHESKSYRLMHLQDELLL